MPAGTPWPVVPFTAPRFIAWLECADGRRHGAWAAAHRAPLSCA
jgi:hypothetical protein